VALPQAEWQNREAERRNLEAARDFREAAWRNRKAARHSRKAKWSNREAEGQSRAGASQNNEVTRRFDRHLSSLVVKARNGVTVSVTTS
jgi:hypothetical protein